MTAHVQEREPCAAPDGGDIAAGYARPRGILIMIPYESDIGFAIIRLVRAFLDAGVALTGATSRVHFAFQRLHAAPSPAFPPGYANLLEFDLHSRQPEALRALRHYVQAHAIDQVMALDLPVGAACCKVLRSAGVGCIIAYWGAPMSSIGGSLRLLLKRVECRIRARSSPSWYIFESEAMRRAAVHGRGVPAARTCIVRTGVDMERFRMPAVPSAAAHERFGIPRDRMIVVYMGHLHERKGVQVLIRAMRMLVNDRGRRDLQALILGNRPHEVAAFAGLVGSDEVAAHITFGGYQDEIPALLGGCHLGCIPSTGWDSFPMSALEMQSCGLPLVVSDLQGVPETVVPGKTGLVVPAGDAEALASAIVRLADDAAMRQRMSVAAVAWVRDNLTRAHQVDGLVRAMRHAYAATA